MKGEYRNRIILFLVLILIILFIRHLGIHKQVTISSLKKNTNLLESYIQKNYMVSVIAYIALYVLLSSLALPVSAVLTIAGGFLFGTVLGALYSNIGATIGSSISFLAIRYFIGTFIQVRFGDRLKSFNREFQRHGYSYLLSIHFVSVVPLFLINIFAALANVSFWTFVWTTTVGVMPGFLLYSFAGKQLTSIESAKDIFSLQIVLALIALAIIAILPIVIRRVFRKGKSSLDYV